jgi:hypothetical protein
MIAMRISLFCVLFGLLFCAVPGWGQPPPTLKKGEELVPPVPPAIYRATAAEVKGEVVVRLSGPSDRVTDKKDAQNVTAMVDVWADLKPLTLGKEVNAYSQTGKPLSKEAVLKALAKQATVVCFVRLKPDDPEQPDPFYTALFRDDTVLLVFKAEALLR